jgi:hypothetical protein
VSGTTRFSCSCSTVNGGGIIRIPVGVRVVCKDGRKRNTFKIKGKGNTIFVLSKGKIVKAADIPCKKK